MAQTKVKEILNSDDSNKDKLGYLWDYYKWHTVVFIIVLIFSGIMINDYINRPIGQFHVAALAPEVNMEEEGALAEDLTELIPPEGPNDTVFVSFIPPGRQYERFVAQFSNGEYDIVLMDEDFYKQYSDSGAMQQFRLSGIDEESYYQPDIYDNPIGVEASQIPQFEQYETTNDLIMMIPGNTQRPETIVEFFETQGFEIELIND
ncbi:MAG: hypothetical protein JJU01_04210 [Alkalibacterium sp.]|nr:hypothetical protein [Alkalibacterium sp.]